jgi:hypothetical protein
MKACSRWTRNSQPLLVSAALEIPLDKDFQALEDLVEAEKAKKEKKSEPPKAKKTAKKSK